MTNPTAIETALRVLEPFAALSADRPPIGVSIGKWRGMISGVEQALAQLTASAALASAAAPDERVPAKHETHSTFGTLAGLQKRIADEPDDMIINILAGEIRGIIAVLPARAASPTGTGTQTDEVRRALEPPKTIYDQRTRVQDAVERAGPQLYKALRQLLDAVEERQGLRESIESIVISDAHSALLVAISPAEAVLASAAAPDERVLTEREQYTVGELLTCRTFDYPRVMTEAHAIIQRLVSARTPDQDTAP